MSAPRKLLELNQKALSRQQSRFNDRKSLRMNQMNNFRPDFESILKGEIAIGPQQRKKQAALFGSKNSTNLLQSKTSFMQNNYMD